MHMGTGTTAAAEGGGGAKPNRRARGGLSGAASCSVLPRPQAESQLRAVPRLALVPLNGPLSVQRHNPQKQLEQEQQTHHEQAQRSLGERFLRLMATLARLQRVDLDAGREDPDRQRRVSRQVRQPSGSPLAPPSGSPPPSKQSSGPSSTSPPALFQQAPTEARNTPPTSSPHPASPSPSHAGGLEDFVARKRQARAHAARQGTAAAASTLEMAAHRPPEPVVNVATAPLREHLTFEISMLLPPPIDTRQSPLHSPIRRRRRARRRRRRRQRPRQPRTWQTSHVTWLPRASMAYVEAREEAEFASRAASRLVAKFAALRGVTGADGNGVGEVPASRRPQASHSGGFLFATDRARRRHQSGGEAAAGTTQRNLEDSDDAGSDSGEARDASDGEVEGDGVHSHDSQDSDGLSEASEGEEEDEDQVPELASAVPMPFMELGPPATAAHERSLAPTKTQRPPRPVFSHQAAWISPELRSWLLHTGLFQTRSVTKPQAQR